MPNNRRVDQEEFIQERLYIELDYRVEDPNKTKESQQQKTNDDQDRGVIIIEIL